MLPPGLSRAERSLAQAVRDGRTVVVNVRKGGPHKNLVPWLTERGLLTYVGHAGARHDWPESDFANPFVKLRDIDRGAMVRRYREWLTQRASLMRRLWAGELTGKALGCWCAPKPCHADVLAELSVPVRTLDSGGPEAAQPTDSATPTATQPADPADPATAQPADSARPAADRPHQHRPQTSTT